MEKKWRHPGRRTQYDGLYRSWVSMKNRAGNKNKSNPSYSDVSICNEWLSYDKFFEDMSSTWFSGASLDKDIIEPGNRIYCKKYCKWVSREENLKELVSRKNGYIGSDNPKARKVRCIECNKIFNCGLDGAKFINHKDQTHILACCRGKRNTAGGYHWEYV